MVRIRHPDKEIEAAVAYAESLGWAVMSIKGYAWGRLYCAHHDRDGCMVSVWSTPRNAGNHAQSVIRNVSRCPHQETEEV